MEPVPGPRCDLCAHHTPRGSRHPVHVADPVRARLCAGTRRRVAFARLPHLPAPGTLASWRPGSGATSGSAAPADPAGPADRLLHLALKHVRYVELVGLLAPLFLASPLAAHWRLAQQSKQQSQSLDQAFRKLAQPAGQGAVFLCAVLLVTATLWWAKARPPAPHEALAPALAIKAVQQAGIKGPVLNSYETGGYLIYHRHSPIHRRPKRRLRRQLPQAVHRSNGTKVRRRACGSSWTSTRSPGRC